MPDNVGDVEFFRALVDAGGVGAGARVLRSSAPAASRRLAALERRLGVKLAERSARRFRLTEEGHLYCQRGGELVAALRDVEAEISSRGTVARGLLRIAAPTDLGRQHIAPALPGFLLRHPGLTIHLMLSDVGAEVAEDGLDIAVRTGLPDDPSVIAHKLVSARMRLCAAPSYLKMHGAPRTLDDLRRHQCLVLTRRHRRNEHWRYLAPSNEWVDMPVAGTLSSADGDVIRCWALQGAGLSLEAAWDIRDDLAEGRLVECLAHVTWRELTLYATFLPGSPLPPRVRLAVDWLAGLM